MQAAFEELCMQIILPKLDAEFSLDVAIEYSQDDENINMQINYTNEIFVCMVFYLQKDEGMI